MVTVHTGDLVYADEVGPDTVASCLVVLIRRDTRSAVARVADQCEFAAFRSAPCRCRGCNRGSPRRRSTPTRKASTTAPAGDLIRRNRASLGHAIRLGWLGERQACQAERPSRNGPTLVAADSCRLSDRSLSGRWETMPRQFPLSAAIEGSRDEPFHETGQGQPGSEFGDEAATGRVRTVCRDRRHREPRT